MSLGAQKNNHLILFIFFALTLLACSSSKSLAIVNNTNYSSFLPGSWVIVTQTSSPLMITQVCDQIKKGTILRFTNNTMEVYIDATRKSCDSFGYKITDKTISFIKGDMIWLCFYELRKDNLKLKSINFFTYSNIEDLKIKKNDIGPEMQEVVVELKRLNE